MKRNVFIGVLCLALGALILMLGIPADRESVGTSPPTVDSVTKAKTVASLPSKLHYPKMPAFGEDKTEVCADCHPDHVEGFKSTGMGKSLYPLTAERIIEPWSSEQSRIVDPDSGLVYTAFQDSQGRFWQEETLPNTDYSHRLEAKLAIGSANHTRSYLGWSEGSLVQLPLTYYVEQKKWDLSPGYRGNNQRMNRPVTPKCLFCHNDLSNELEGTLATYTSPLAMGISCERCHGNGDAHVEYRMEGGIPEEGKADTTILNPKHLSAIRQQQMCEQCHLQGRSRRLLTSTSWTDYRPQQPLHEFMTIHVEESNSNEFGIASHGARLQQSACYKAQKLTCTQCHDPHQRSTSDTYVDTCKGCHASGCEEPKHTNGYCPECHMPKGTPSDIPHVTVSDHFIRVVQTSASNAATEHRLVDPHADLRALTPLERDRNLAIAHFDDLQPNDSQLMNLSQQVVDTRLVADIESAPTSWNGLQTLASYYMKKRQYAEAATALESMSTLRPEDQHTRVELAFALAKNGEVHRAQEILDTIPETLRFRPRYGAVLAEIAVKDADFDMNRLTAYLEQHPSNDRVPLMMAGREIERSNPNKALRIVQKALKRDPVTPTLLFMAANLEFDRRNYGQVVIYLDRLMLSNPSFDAGRWLRARSLTKLGRLSESLNDLKIVHENQPTNLDILEDRLRTLVAAKRGKEAKLILETNRSQLNKEVYHRLYQMFSSAQ